MYENLKNLIDPNLISNEEAEKILQQVGFKEIATAHARIVQVCDSDSCRIEFAKFLPNLLVALSNAALPDSSLLNFERYVQSVPDRTELFLFLSKNPRAIEILIKLFVGSQFLTEILLQNSDYLQELTRHKRLSDFKSQSQYFEEAYAATNTATELEERFAAVHKYHRWELLRIGACDTFGLMDLKTITLQLSLLADGIVETSLQLLGEDLGISTEGFAVLAFGKLGGEEINYSSDIDLVFIARENASQFWTLGQRLIKALMEPTAQGFFYRVDMRLRPWGRSGALVTTVDSYLDYLRKQGMLWEKQALIKARGIAGDRDVSANFLKQVQPIIYNCDPEEARLNVQSMKEKIEANLKKTNRDWGEVKAGVGSIRDVEFVTQYLQLANGKQHPHVRSINTLDGLIRLADHSLIRADEYRQLSSGYIFLRTIEHALQLMHYKQVHALPENARELAYLAHRLDFPDVDHFVSTYRRHCVEIRKVYERYIDGESSSETKINTKKDLTFAQRLAQMEPSYAKRYSKEELNFHSQLLENLDKNRLVKVHAEPLASSKEANSKENKSLEEETLTPYKLTIVGHDFVGLMSAICGLLFAYGYDITSGDVFTGQSSEPLGKETPKKENRRFICVFTVLPPLSVVPEKVWERYQDDLQAISLRLKKGNQKEAYGQLAKHVANAVLNISTPQTQLYPIEINIDNTSSELYTVLDIHADDTPGFLYELGNGLALRGIQIQRVVVQSVGDRVADTLYVTNREGGKILDPNRERELRAAVVLIKHFSHLLPQSPNPESALIHFHEFLERLFEQENWIEDLAVLEQSSVLETLAKMLGVSDFLWADFLRLQHSNLFPVVANTEALAKQKTLEELEAELQFEINACEKWDDKINALNAFKDREMLRIDLRHILNYQTKFGQFSLELTDVAEVVTQAAYYLQDGKLRTRYGTPCPVAICALGKCGGKELGFASDIELMFIYKNNEMTKGDNPISNAEYYQKLVEGFQKIIHTKRDGIFEIDLRLRPYGKAGSLAVSCDAFKHYFKSGGPAWPYERQALVKLRPVAGDDELKNQVVKMRDELIYTGERFDVTAMRGMREKQLRQLVKAGAINAKLSPGGLVDCEYLVQGLQITFGHIATDLRSTNTREAMKALEKYGYLSTNDRILLRDSYRFLRRLIDALRMVRGDAHDLTIPPANSNEFEFLARRLNYHGNPQNLLKEIEQAMATVIEMTQILDDTC